MHDILRNNSILIALSLIVVYYEWLINSKYYVKVGLKVDIFQVLPLIVQPVMKCSCFKKSSKILAQK